jgi:hypothetical protein
MVLRRISIFVVALVVTASVSSTSTQAAAPKCAQGGVCRIGNIGPAGGRIVYDAGSLQWWGQYLEAVPVPAGAAFDLADSGHAAVGLSDELAELKH